MAVQRLPRGTRVHPVPLGWRIEEHRKKRVEQLAAHVGVSAAVFLEAVIDHIDDELTPRGIPSWWSEPDLKDGELPIDAP